MLKKLIPVFLLTYSFSLQMAAAAVPESIRNSMVALTDDQYYRYAAEIAEMLTDDYIGQDTEESYAPLPTGIGTLLQNASGRNSPTQPVIDTLSEAHKNFLKETETERTDASIRRECFLYRRGLIGSFAVFRSLARTTKTENPRTLLLENIIKLWEEETNRYKRALENKTIECPICNQKIENGHFFACKHFTCESCYKNISPERLIKNCPECRAPIHQLRSIITKKQIEKERLEKARNDRRVRQQQRQPQQRAPSPLTPAFIPVPRVPTNSHAVGQLTTRRFNTGPDLTRSPHTATTNITERTDRPVRPGRTATVTPAADRPYRDFEGAEDMMYDIEGNPIV